MAHALIKSGYFKGCQGNIVETYEVDGMIYHAIDLGENSIVHFEKGEVEEWTGHNSVTKKSINRYMAIDFSIRAGSVRRRGLFSSPPRDTSSGK